MSRAQKYRLYFSAMIFAFLWVIIGDLVNMHIHVITGKDLYGHHHPFAKTQKSEKKSFKVKGKSGNNNNSNTYALSFNFISEKIQNFFAIQSSTDFLYWFVPKFIASVPNQNSLGRAPPCS